MIEDLNPYIDAGKITAAAAEALSNLSPGAFCTHRSWGFGKIAGWELITGQITIDFGTKKGHPMQLQYAAETLTHIPSEHILARAATNAAAVREQAASDPVGLVRSILADHGGQATADEIAETMVPSVFDPASFKKWFDAAKKKLKTDGHFLIPTKKGEPIVLQETSQNPHERLIGEFRAARHPKGQVAALDTALKSLNDFAKEVEELRSLATEVEEAAKRGGRIHAAKAIELLIIRDEICARHESLKPGPEAASIASLLADAPAKLIEIFDEIPAAKYGRVLEAFPAAFPENWEEKVLRLTRTSEPRLSGEIFKLFVAQGKREAFAEHTRRLIRERSASSDYVLWLCKDRSKTLPELIDEELFAAILAAMEADLHADIKSKRLEEFLFEDRDLVADLLGKAERDSARQAFRKIMLSPVFADLNRRSLLARILKIHPELESLVTGDQEAPTERAESLVVSWASLQRRKEELEHIEKVLIPQNIRDIATARSYGDLRENFEFKSAKEQQAVLNRQKGELELMLNNSRGTNFENVDTSAVSIGSVVTVEPSEGGAPETYSILGAWDGVPEKGWVSYQAVIGKALLGKKIGEVIDLPADKGIRSMKIVTIEPFADLAALGSTEGTTS
ncbi:MAG: GreA/GreB family elongation factor [Verrucomicrobiota bacterium]